MAIVTTDNQYYSDIAAAIRKKLGVSRQYRPDEMAAAIQSIGNTVQGIPMTFRGNPITAANTIAGQPFAGLKVFGKTAQDEAAGLTSAGNDGQLDILIRGAQLIDKNTFFVNPPVGSGVVKYYPLYVASGTYTLSTACPSVGNVANLFLLSGDVSSSADSGMNGAWDGRPMTAQASDGYVTIGLRTNHPSNPHNPLDYNIMLNYGTEALPWEPYTGQSLTLSASNGLPGVPVSSGGNCIDSAGQAYTSDYWDFGDSLQHILCGKISSYNGEEITTPYISSTGDLTTGAQVVYVLPEPQTQPIPAETMAAYQALTTYAGTTVISTTAPIAAMEATVYCDAAKAMDSKVSTAVNDIYADLSGAIREGVNQVE